MYFRWYELNYNVRPLLYKFHEITGGPVKYVVIINNNEKVTACYKNIKIYGRKSKLSKLKTIICLILFMVIRT